MIEFIFEDTFIQDPSMDETGRYCVEPIEYYGKSYLKALKKAYLKAKEDYSKLQELKNN
tara:strand:+ start:31 stop:207 length:177 start_codon:yes stop_codon:yes gene_type:complete